MSSALTTLKMALLAPMPMASVMTAMNRKRRPLHERPDAITDVF